MNCKLRLSGWFERLTGNPRGYHITMLKDATAGFSKAQKDAATELIWPLFANQVKTVGEWIETLDK
jgi:hypothetical protein